MGCPWLTNDALGSRLVKEQIVGNRAEKCERLGAAKVPGIADQAMPAAIEILALIMRTETILTRPVEFEIASRLVIKIRDNTKDMRVTLLVQKIGLERLRALCKLPEKETRPWFIQP